jgi:hypothetical protein
MSNLPWNLHGQKHGLLMRVSVLLLPLICCVHGYAQGRPAANSFTGEWTLRTECSANSRCREGDIFQLYDLTQDGDVVCGHYLISYDQGAHVDETGNSKDPVSLLGKARGGHALVDVSGFGQVKLTIQGNQLHWDVVRRSKPASSADADMPLTLPDHVVLTRTARVGSETLACPK